MSTSILRAVSHRLPFATHRLGASNRFFTTVSAADVPFFYNTKQTPPLDAKQVMLNSLATDNTDVVQETLNTPLVKSMAAKVAQAIHANQISAVSTGISYQFFLAGLCAMKDELITPAQLASLHILDAATYTLGKRRTSFFGGAPLNITIETGCVHRSVTVEKYHFTHSDSLPIELLNIPRYKTFHTPLIRQYFNFSDSEWAYFITNMAAKELSEQYFHLLPAPQLSCWSTIVRTIEELLVCLGPFDRMIIHDDGHGRIHKVMPVPSFSMLQVALEAKASCQFGRSVRLMPTYGYLPFKDYKQLKEHDCIALALYWPEKSLDKRYRNDSNFRQEVDGHPYQTAFAGCLHDMYHALREQQMTHQCSLGRFRFAQIASLHPDNHPHGTLRSVEETLIDGELLFQHPNSDTSFQSRLLPKQPHEFGDIFYCPALKDIVSPALKQACILDMVNEKQLWQQVIGIGPEQLHSSDQKLYQTIQNTLFPDDPCRIGSP